MRERSPRANHCPTDPIGAKQANMWAAKASNYAAPAANGALSKKKKKMWPNPDNLQIEDVLRARRRLTRQESNAPPAISVCRHDRARLCAPESKEAPFEYLEMARGTSARMPGFFFSYSRTSLKGRIERGTTPTKEDNESGSSAASLQFAGTPPEPGDDTDRYVTRSKSTQKTTPAIGKK